MGQTTNLRITGGQREVEQMLNQAMRVLERRDVQESPLAQGARALCRAPCWEGGGVSLTSDHGYAELAATKFAELARQRGLDAEVTVADPGEFMLFSKDGQEVVATVEAIPGTAGLLHVTVEPDGRLEPEWDGETTMEWNGQKTVRVDGVRQFVDDFDNEYDEDELFLVHPDERDAFLAAVQAGKPFEHLVRRPRVDRDPAAALTKEQLAQWFMAQTTQDMQRGRFKLEALVEQMAEYALSEPAQVRRDAYAQMQEQHDATPTPAAPKP